MRTIMSIKNNNALTVYFQAFLGTAAYFVFAAACLGLGSMV